MIPIPAAASPPEFELKYLLPGVATAAAHGALRTLCRPDGRHPANDVLTVYFDTPQLDCLHDKLASHLYKTKLRLRWYEGGAAQSAGRGFLELKFRLGPRRRKLRVETPFAAGWLRSLPLNDRRLARMPELLRGHGLILPAGLRPVLTVRYRRRRYQEPITRARVSLDCAIRVAAVHRGLLRTPPDRALQQTVLEVKNRSGELPPVLRTLLRLGARRSSFSKYLACFERAVASHAVAA